MILLLNIVFTISVFSGYGFVCMGGVCELWDIHIYGWVLWVYSVMIILIARYYENKYDMVVKNPKHHNDRD